MALDEFAYAVRDLAALAVDAALKSDSNFFGGVARPALGRIEGADAERRCILSRYHVTDDGGEVCLALVGLALGGTGAEVLEHQLYLPIEPIGRNKRGKRPYARTPLTGALDRVRGRIRRIKAR